jgi:hypothetical protein
MRLLLALGLAALSLPAAAQTRILPHPGSTTASGGASGEAMRVTTYAERAAPAGRLSRRYRGIAVNRSPRTAAHGASAPGGFVSGNVVMPALRTPQGDFVRRGGSTFRVLRGR